MSDETAPSAPLQNQDDAELAMFQLSNATRNRQVLAAERDQAIADLREKYREVLEKIDKNIRSLKGQLQTWAKKQRAAWRKEKRESVDLTHGRVGFRSKRSDGLQQPTKKSRKEVEEKLIQLLREHGLDHCVAVHESVDWQELAKEADETLAVLGVKRISGERFYVDPRTDRFADSVAAPGANKDPKNQGVA